MSDAVAMAFYDKDGSRMALEEHVPDCSRCLGGVLDEACGLSEPVCAGHRVVHDRSRGGDGCSALFCFSPGVSAKHARARARVLNVAAKGLLSVLKDLDDAHKVQVQGVIHNMRSLNARVKHTLYDVFGDSLEEADREAVRLAVTGDPREAVRAVLVAAKVSDLMSSELDIFEWLSDSYVVLDVDRGFHSLHRLVMLVFYVHSADLRVRRVHIQVADSELVAWVHFETVKTALLQLFDNIVKYCREGSVVEVAFRSDEVSVWVDFWMESLAIRGGEQSEIWSRGFRGEAAETAGEAGDGLGLMIARRMIELNSGEVGVDAGPVTIRSGAREYAINKFSFRLPARR